ncbi:MAG: DUF3991 and toprim domain-containing protein [Alphaproteobacteria bacterium]|nr:DUF3991 and toprim domain-containing protein [Alphaproteobacteria bacterium]
MTTRRDFSQFKKAINLTQYAACAGYCLDRKKSTKASVAMRHANGDKIIISRRGPFWVYFSTHDESDNGTIIDFIIKRTGKTLGEIGQELDSWIGEARPFVNPDHYADAVTEQSYDRGRVQCLFASFKPLTSHEYLEQERKISRAVLQESRFAGKLFSDKYGNVVFPHFDKEGLCGLELKNADKGVMTRGSAKGLWTSKRLKTDTTLVITESGIDALSYHDLFRPTDTAYAAVSGTMKKDSQFDLALDLIGNFPHLRTIILAVDNDAGGANIAGKIETAVKAAGLFTGTVRRHIPDTAGQDWNEHLKTRR